MALQEEHFGHEVQDPQRVSLLQSEQTCRGVMPWAVSEIRQKGDKATYRAAAKALRQSP